MGLRINTNVTSLAAQRTLGQNNKEQAQSLEKLSSGSRIVRASDDAAGLAISEKLISHIRGIRQAERNANDGISLVQTAEGGLNEISSILTRLRELSVQASSDTIGEVERGFADYEYQSLKKEIERIAQVTEFNGKKLLNGAGDKFDFQVGINNNSFQDRIMFNAAQTNASLNGLKVRGLSLRKKAEAQKSLDVLDSAIENISGQRANLGAIQNRLNSTIRNLQVFSENMSSANSRIRDTDFAEETSNTTRLNILINSGSAVLAQANARGQAVLALLR